MPGVLKSSVSVAGGTNTVGSPTVSINGKPAVRVGDAIQPHGRSPHNNAVMATGSATVFVNGIPLCRDGDVASCGHVASGGSSDVNCG